MEATTSTMVPVLRRLVPVPVFTSSNINLSANVARKPLPMEFVTKVNFGKVNVKCRENRFARRSQSLGNILEEFNYHATMMGQAIKLAKSVLDVNNNNMESLNSSDIAVPELEELIWEFLYGSEYLENNGFEALPPGEVGEFLAKSDDFYAIFSHICHVPEISRFGDSIANCFKVPKWNPNHAHEQKVKARSNLRLKAMEIDRKFLNSAQFQHGYVIRSSIIRP